MALTHFPLRPRRWARPAGRAAHRATAAVAASLVLLLSACGGGDDNDGNDGGNTPSARNPGDLVAAQAINQISVADINAALNAPDSKVQGKVTPLYAVNSYRLTYLTTDKNGVTTTASGLVSVPVKPTGARSPIISCVFQPIVDGISG